MQKNSYDVALFDVNKKVNPEENEKLINEIATAGENKDELAWKLAQNNYPLIPSIINKQFTSQIDQYSQMLSDGMVGLFKACKNVKEGTQNKVFACYASRYIFGHILDGVNERRSVIHYPRSTSRNNDVYLDTLSFETKEFSCEADQDNLLKKSDGDFCKTFLQDTMEAHENNKTDKRRAFFTDKCKQVMKSIATSESYDDLHKSIGVTKQRIEQIRQDIFSYMVQQLRDCSKKEQNEFFSVVFNGKYSVDNPPPFSAWRKRIWDNVMTSKRGVYKRCSRYTPKGMARKLTEE